MNRRLDSLLGTPLVKLLSFFSRKAPQKEIKKVLVIKLAAVGDTILLIPVLRALRQAQPALRIDWLVSPINESIAKTVPYVDGLIVWNKSFFSLPRLVSRLRQEKYDAVVDFEQWARGTALISFFSGATVRAGFDTPGEFRAGLFTHKHRKNFDQHEIKDFFELASLVIPIPENQRLELFLTEKGAHEWQVAQKKKAPFKVLIHPGCGSDGGPREWPLSKYAVLIHWLQKKYAAQIFLTGGPEERKKTGDLNQLVANSAVNLGGRLSWDATTSLVKDMELVISGNTGVMHVAAALNKPQIALHGPTNPLLWGPLNSKARILQTTCERCPCLKLGFEYHSGPLDCMNKIEVQEVKKAVESLVEQ